MIQTFISILKTYERVNNKKEKQKNQKKRDSTQKRNKRNFWSNGERKQYLNNSYATDPENNQSTVEQKREFQEECFQDKF